MALLGKRNAKELGETTLDPENRLFGDQRGVTVASSDQLGLPA